METLLIVSIAFSGLILAAAIYIMMQRKPQVDLEQSAKLQVLTDHIFRLQGQLSEQLQTQEREISKKLEDRLADLTRRVGTGLQENIVETQKNLSALQERLAVIDSAQKNITELSTQMVSLQDILSSKDKRGVFGEVQLKDLVTSVLPPSSYEFQATLSNTTRPDCLIKLPHPPGPIVVDAKFPLESFEELCRAEDASACKVAGRKFATAIEGHVSDISRKYIIPGETADSALMFLPSESIYAELYANFPDTVRKAFSQKVWIVSPTTLMATLNTVRAVMKDARMQEQAGLILKHVGEIAQDVGRLDERVEKLQKHFNMVNADVHNIRVSTDKIISRAEKLDDVQLEKIENDLSEALQAEPQSAPRRLTGS